MRSPLKRHNSRVIIFNRLRHSGFGRSLISGMSFGALLWTFSIGLYLFSDRGSILKLKSRDEGALGWCRDGQSVIGLGR